MGQKGLRPRRDGEYNAYIKGNSQDKTCRISRFSLYNLAEQRANITYQDMTTC